MKFLITGGGTGGHIYPALAIVEEIKKDDKNNQVLYVGTKDSLEEKLVTKKGLDFETVRVKGLPRKINLEFVRAIKELLLGLNDSRKILNEYKPDVVIGTGGYVCGPIVIIAALKGIPTIIHEQNAYPGITNKILGRFVDKIAITFDEARKHFKKQDRIVNTGNPIREGILNINKDRAFEELGLDKDKFTILSFGGSGGQKTLNDAILGLIEELPEEIQLLHVTGKRLYDEFEEDFEKRNLNEYANIHIYSYLYEMPEALNIADLVITPAGAITLAEISALGKPSILVPKSYTAENHQEYNANYFLDNDAARVILEKNLTNKEILKNILCLYNDDEKLNHMAQNASCLGKKDASSNILKEIKELL